MRNYLKVLVWNIMVPFTKIWNVEIVAPDKFQVWFFDSGLLRGSPSESM